MQSEMYSVLPFYMLGVLVRTIQNPFEHSARFAQLDIQKFERVRGVHKTMLVRSVLSKKLSVWDERSKPVPTFTGRTILINHWGNWDSNAQIDGHREMRPRRIYS